MRTRGGIPLLISGLVGLGVFGLHRLHFFDRTENISVDLRFKLRDMRQPSPDIVMVTVDDQALQETGLWSWPRQIHGRMVDYLAKAGAKVIVFDILFLEKDVARPESDAAFGRALARAGRGVLGIHFDRVGPDGPESVALPIPALENPRTEVGYATILPETDGIVRRGTLWANLDGQFVPSLALAAAAVAKNQKPEDIARGIRGVEKGPWNEAIINFTGWDVDQEGRWRSPFPSYSYGSVLKGKFAPALFKDKIVIVCGTATGLFDYKPVPTLNYFPGPEIQANIIDNILSDNFLRLASPGWKWLLVALLVLANVAILAFAPAWLGAVVVALWAIVYFMVCQSVFESRQVILPYIQPTAAFAGAYFFTLFYAFLKEEKEKRWIKGTFSQYLSPKVVEILTREPERLKLGGEEREITVFFSDVAGFTTLSESMSPTALVSVLNEYLSAMSDIILAHEGVLDKYIGDAIMAFWNAPVDQPKGPMLACLAALEQAEALKVIQRKFAERQLPFVDCRMGLNTGHAVVGNMGSRTRFDYTAMGDTVNLASRLEAANKAYGTRIMIAEATRNVVAHELATRELDLLRVKGKNIPMKVYELLGKLSDIPGPKREAMGLFEDGLGAYRAKRFKQAVERFTAVLKILPEDGPAKLYIARSEEFLKAPPPPDWDGVYVMTHK